jgi:signal peptidase I
MIVAGAVLVLVGGAYGPIAARMGRSRAKARPETAGAR